MLARTLGSKIQCGTNDVVLRGTAVPYDQPSTDPLDASGIADIFRYGCFAGSLNEDLRLTFNFSANCILGRRSAGTVEFWDEPGGLQFECVPPPASWADDLLVSISRGDIAGSGIACKLLAQHLEDRRGQRVRVIEKAQLLVVAIMPFSAFDCGINVVRQQQDENSEQLAAASDDRKFLKQVGIQGSRL